MGPTIAQRCQGCYIRSGGLRKHSLCKTPQGHASKRCLGIPNLRAGPKPLAQQSVAPRKVKKSENVTLPMQVKVTEQLLALDGTNTPLWSTFCGLTNGVWQGKMAALYAATGEREAVSKAGKELVYEMHTLAVEERPDDGVILRRVLRSDKLSTIRAATLDLAKNAQEASNLVAAADDGSSELDSPEWEVNQIDEEEEGLIIFDGGTFSRGPHWLVDPSKEDLEPSSLDLDESRKQAEQVAELEIGESNQEQDSPNGSGQNGAAIPANFDYGVDNSVKRKTSVIEQCLAWGGEQRLRLILTVSVGVDDSELDVEVLRLVLVREAWQGLAESCAKDACVPADVESPDESSMDLGAQPRASAKDYEGRWKAYDVSAVPIDEQDPLTGETRKINLYYVQETFQQWSQGRPNSGLDGAAIWLPGRVLLEIQMISPSTRGTKADTEEGMQENQGRGLLITFSWNVNKTTVIGIHREYGANGELLECRSRSAVKGSWVGGSM